MKGGPVDDLKCAVAGNPETAVAGNPETAVAGNPETVFAGTEIQYVIDRIDSKQNNLKVPCKNVANNLKYSITINVKLKPSGKFQLNVYLIIKMFLH